MSWLCHVSEIKAAPPTAGAQYGTCTLLTDLYLELHCICTLSPALAVGRYKSSLAVPPITPSKYLCLSSPAQPIRCLRSNAKIDPRHDCSPTDLEDCVSRKSHEQTHRFVPLHRLPISSRSVPAGRIPEDRGCNPQNARPVASACMCLMPTGSKVRVQVLVQYIRWLVNPHMPP